MTLNGKNLTRFNFNFTRIERARKRIVRRKSEPKCSAHYPLFLSKDSAQLELGRGKVGSLSFDVTEDSAPKFVAAEKSQNRKKENEQKLGT